MKLSNRKFKQMVKNEWKVILVESSAPRKNRIEKKPAYRLPNIAAAALILCLYSSLLLGTPKTSPFNFGDINSETIYSYISKINLSEVSK